MKENSSDSFRYLKNDLQEAISEVFEDEYELEAFNVKKQIDVKLNKALSMAKNSYRPFIEPASLVNSSPNEIFDTIRKIKGDDFAAKAKTWVTDGFPAIIFTVINSTDQNPDYLLGDGHHRLALADAIGLKKISIAIVQLKN
jgi:hypothetical protein